MFVRIVRAAAIGVVFACAAGFAAAQETQFTPASEFPASEFDGAPASSEDLYVADPSESFVVEHSNTVAAVAPRRPPPATRCREYSSDAAGSYESGLACPQSDGSWRIVSGPEEMTAARDLPPVREERARARAYPDYTDDEPEYRPEYQPEYQDQPRPGRRLGFDWNAWRRGSDRSARGRFNE